MRRRQFIAGLAGAAAWPLAARAQQSERIRKVGVLLRGDLTLNQSYMTAFRQGLRQSGWIEGQNLRIDVRFNADDAALARTNAVELIGLTPDVILAGSTVNLIPVAQVTRTVPVVFVSVADPVAQGFVASVRHPGGNLTGFSLFEFSLGGKWLDLLKQVAPSLTRVAMIFNPDTAPYSKFFIEVIEAAAPSLGVQPIAFPVQASADIEAALASFARQPNGGLITWGTDLFSFIVDLARRYRLPSISPGPIVKDGGLMDYGPSIDLPSRFRQAATYVDRILKGEKPADLPIQAPTKYWLVINLKSAKALGLTIPETLLATADEVIQ
jgi:putative tryptophan/tyrosine transport system substrate-binding protein